MASRSVTLYPETIPAMLPLLCKYKTGPFLYRILHAIGQDGFSTRSDFALAMGLDMSSQRAKKTSLQRISRGCKILTEEGLIEQLKTDALYHVEIFNLIKLSDKGIAHCRNAYGPYGWENVVMSDWDKLIAWHNGTKDIKHAALILNFAFHARLRGWNAIVTPHNTENNCEPDVMITKDGQIFHIEVERQSCRTEQKPRKWENQYQAQGRIAACYSLRRSTYHAAGSFIYMGYSKFNLTSLEYLQKSAYNQPDGRPGRLWQYISEEIFNG